MSRGHSYGDVLNVYTMEQITAFAEGARKNRNEEIAEIATAFRFSQAGEKDWKRYIGSITKDDGPKANKPQRVATKEEIASLLSMGGRRAG